MVGGALFIRQRHLRSSPVVDAAATQVAAAEAVHALLGGPVASTNGMVGGYTDPVQGTAVITMPIVSDAGVRAVARAEAEAEWVLLEKEAEARGEPPPERQLAGNCRWLVRHLDVELIDPPAGMEPSSVVLYSLPSNVALSPWAPERESSARSPHWLRALFPRMSAVASDEAMPRIMSVAAIAIVMHAVAFLSLRGRMKTDQVLRQVESALSLPMTPALEAVRDAAVRAARRVPGASPLAGAPLFGFVRPNELIAYTALPENQELFFRAELTPIKGKGSDWVLTQVAIERTVSWASRLQRLPEGTPPEDGLAAMLAMPSPNVQRVDLGMGDHRIRLPPGALLAPLAGKR